MSSHREAPEISKDPVADNTDVYAFVSPDAPDSVTLIANYIPLEAPAGGPNFFEFGDDVLYTINIDNTGSGLADVSYEFRFRTHVRNAETFLYNTGPIRSLDDATWNRRQLYSVTRRTRRGSARMLGDHLPCPPCVIGPLSTPDYGRLARAAVRDLGGGRKVFAGQRADAFYVDLAAVFDLGNLRPFQQLHEQYGLGVFTKPAPGVNGLAGFNVHTIALQVPIRDVTADGSRPHDPMSPRAAIGVWAAASRRKVKIRRGEGAPVESGPWEQVSRLGNPLFNEVIVPMGDKDDWNTIPPRGDSDFAKYVRHPELARLLPALYPGVFPKLAALNASGKPRADLAAVLLTGLPPGIVPGFQNFTGRRPADELRLNVAIPPSSRPNLLGILGGDLAGFPNGRRVLDDVVTVELRAIAGATYPLVDSSFTPDAATSLVTDGLTPDNSGVMTLATFPYLADPHPPYTAAA